MDHAASEAPGVNTDLDFVNARVTVQESQSIPAMFRSIYVKANLNHRQEKCIGNQCAMKLRNGFRILRCSWIADFSRMVTRRKDTCHVHNRSVSGTQSMHGWLE